MSVPSAPWNPAIRKSPRLLSNGVLELTADEMIGQRFADIEVAGDMSAVVLGLRPGISGLNLLAETESVQYANRHIARRSQTVIQDLASVIHVPARAVRVRLERLVREREVHLRLPSPVRSLLNSRRTEPHEQTQEKDVRMEDHR